jgi:hypothetical protein
MIHGSNPLWADRSAGPHRTWLDSTSMSAYECRHSCARRFCRALASTRSSPSLSCLSEPTFLPLIAATPERAVLTISCQIHAEEMAQVHALAILTTSTSYLRYSSAHAYDRHVVCEVADPFDWYLTLDAEFLLASGLQTYSSAKVSWLKRSYALCILDSLRGRAQQR